MSELVPESTRAECLSCGDLQQLRLGSSAVFSRSSPPLAVGTPAAPCRGTMNHDAMKLMALLAMCSGPALAQSTVEKAKAKGNEVKRELKKGAHRVGEELCMGTRVECAKKKVENRATETKDTVVDGAKELKDKVDRDGT